MDAKNAFNEQNRTAMVWTVRHEWPSGAVKKVSRRETRFRCLLMVDYYHSFVLSRYSFQIWIRLGTRTML
jgi:hypothetical protein